MPTKETINRALFLHVMRAFGPSSLDTPPSLRQLHGLLPCFTQASAQTSSPGRPSWIPRPRQDLLSPVTSLSSWTALLTTCHHFLCVLKCICFSVPKARMKLSLSCVTLSRLKSIRLSLPSYKMGTMRTLPHGLSQIQGGMDRSPEHTCSICSVNGPHYCQLSAPFCRWKT